ncbi:hypothetical protein LA20531_07255 [Lactobacillus amylovorus DSM 20531]|nr:hypothetical protein LA20531_07255 [Lactobacillus amylovorus DSM 20531]MCT3593188.1 hypothetical protein [Lactobacillus amylovorus]
MVERIFIVAGGLCPLFYAIKNLLTAYHTDKSSTGKIIEPFFRLRPKSETLLGLYYFVQFEIMNKNRIFLKEYVSMPDLIY